MQLADLFASRELDSVRSWGAIEQYLAGECDLAEGLGLEPGTVDGMRRQARALAESGRWIRAIEVMLGVNALGSVNPGDALLLESCDRALGHHSLAVRDRAIGTRLLRAMGEESTLSLFEVREGWEEARRLASAVESQHAFLRSRQVGSDPKTVAIAVKAAGLCEATAKFPSAQLSELAKQADARPRTQRRPVLARLASFDPVRELGRILGDSALGESLRGKPHLGALAALIDQASSAPDYSMTRVGEFHPGSRVGYLHREHSAISTYLSEGRHEHSHSEAHRIARSIAAGRSSEEAIVEYFVGELGVHSELSASWKPTFEAVVGAIDCEALFPLRCLAETVQDMADESGESYGPIRDAVNVILKRAVEGTMGDLDLLWSVPFDREPHRLVKEFMRWFV